MPGYIKQDLKADNSDLQKKVSLTRLKSFICVWVWGLMAQGLPQVRLLLHPELHLHLLADILFEDQASRSCQVDLNMGCSGAGLPSGVAWMVQACTTVFSQITIIFKKLWVYKEEGRSPAWCFPWRCEGDGPTDKTVGSCFTPLLCYEPKNIEQLHIYTVAIHA